MANQCSHTHICYDCNKPYICWGPECVALAGDTCMLCERCSFKVWVRAKGTEETGVCQ